MWRVQPGKSMRERRSMRSSSPRHERPTYAGKCGSTLRRGFSEVPIQYAIQFVEDAPYHVA